MHLNLVEFEDLSWFPATIRDGGTDYLCWLLNVLNFYSPAALLVSESLYQADEKTIIDLCSGGGGPWGKLYKQIRPGAKILLTDLYPNVNAYKLLRKKSNGSIDYIDLPVDATNVHYKGLRTMFSAFHHFAPHKAKAILQNAIDNNTGIAIFDGGDKNIFMILAVLIIHPIAFLLCTPFLRPFRLSRIFFTYIIPLIPLYTMWDGIISILRLYSPNELLQLTKEMNAEHYSWKTGRSINGVGLHLTFLIGYPKSQYH